MMRIPFAAGLSSCLLLAACSKTPHQESAEATEHAHPDVEQRTSAILDGEPAEGTEYDAVGALVAKRFSFDEATQRIREVSGAFCTGTLISDTTVLTAKHCAELVRHLSREGDMSLHFAVGPDADKPSQLVPIVDHFYAPGDEGGFLHYGRDVAVVFLGDKVKGVKPATFASPRADMTGQALEVVGYGFQDNDGTRGTRRKGRVTLSAQAGKIFEVAFGSFTGFDAWLDEVLPGRRAGFVGSPGGADAGLPFDAGLALALDDGGADAAQAQRSEGDSPADDHAFWQRWYDGTKLMEGYELFVGREPGGPQPCYGDSGGPLARHLPNGKLEVYAVASGGLRSASEAVCDYGTVFAALGPEILDFLHGNKKDACKGVSRLGQCRGDKLERCTTEAEGKRRVVEERCALGCEVDEGQARCARGQTGD